MFGWLVAIMLVISGLWKWVAGIAFILFCMILCGGVEIFFSKLFFVLCIVLGGGALLLIVENHNCSKK